MNAGLQCVANSPYVREFFVKGETGTLAPFEYSVNIDNPLAFDGDFAVSFGETVASIWEKGAYLSVWPRKFKKQLGVVKKAF